MTAIAPLAATRAELHLPRLALASCVRAFVVRDTRGVALDDLQRVNFLPAMPLCTVSWWLAGEGRWPAPGEPGGPGVGRPAAAPVLFNGPLSAPLTSWTPGPAHVLSVLLLPDAMQVLAGLAPADHVDRFSPVDAVLPPDWGSMCAAVQAAADDATRIRLIEDFLEPRWRRVAPAHRPVTRRYGDWLQAVALRAATSSPGRSLRQVERRFKHWVGLPLRQLNGVSRSEQVFFRARQQQRDDGAVHWASIAADSGYADQSHLCRETRRVTGFSPEALRHGIAADERFWAYRIWT